MERLRLVRPRKWQTNIHGMLSRIPSISFKALKKYFDSINSKLSVYEDLEDAPMLLELVLWKSKIIEQFDRSSTTPVIVDTKMQCRIDSQSMVAIIVPNVLPFLTDGHDNNNVVGCDDDDIDDYGDSNSDYDSHSGNSDESVEDDEDWDGGDDDGNGDNDIMVVDNDI